MTKPDEDQFDRRSSIRLEQHIGTILQITVVGLLAWSLSTTQNMSKEVEVLKVRVESLSATISQGTSDRYRGADAVKDFRSVWDELTRHEKRIQHLEERRR